MTNTAEHLTPKQREFVHEFARQGTSIEHTIVQYAIDHYNSDIIAMFEASHQEQIPEGILEKIYQQHKEEIRDISRNVLEYDMRPNEAPERRYDCTAFAVYHCLDTLLPQFETLG